MTTTTLVFSTPFHLTAPDIIAGSQAALWPSGLWMGNYILDPKWPLSGADNRNEVLHTHVATENNTEFTVDPAIEGVNLSWVLTLLGR